jgi:hypothetical protein
MAINPVEICLIGGVGSFSLGLRLRKFKVPETAPKSRAHLTREERQHKIKIAERILYSNAAVFLAGAALLAWLRR